MMLFFLASKKKKKLLLLPLPLPNSCFHPSKAFSRSRVHARPSLIFLRKKSFAFFLPGKNICLKKGEEEEGPFPKFSKPDLSLLGAPGMDLEERKRSFFPELRAEGRSKK